MNSFIGITVCVNYADKLGPVLEQNMKYFKKIYVVTDPMDFDTFDALKTYPKVELILNDEVHKNGANFNKSSLVLSGQQAAHKHVNDWIIYFDADTVLPDDFAEIIKATSLSKDLCYHMKRRVYKTKEDFDTDTNFYETRGAGFFQLYFDKSKFYPSFSRSAAVCDDTFEKRFGGRVPTLLPGFCKHLGPNGKDWDKRESPQWA
jgi:hypothetical protein